MGKSVLSFEQEKVVKTHIGHDRKWFIKKGFVMSSTDKNGGLVYRPTFALIILAFMLIVFAIVIFVAGRWTGFEAGKKETEDDKRDMAIEEIKRDVKTSKEFQIKNTEILKNNKREQKENERRK